MTHIFHGHFSVLESDERKNTMPAKKILKEINIKEGNTLIDFGCGIGYFSIPATEFVGETGKVFCIDISDDMINELKTRAQGIKNIEIIQSDTLRNLKADIILIVNVFHEVEDPKQFCLECKDALYPGGRIIIIDWQKKETVMGPPVHHRFAKEEVISMMNAEYSEHKINDAYYFLEFKK